MTRMDPAADMELGRRPVPDWRLPSDLTRTPRTVLVLMVAFNWDLERCAGEAKAIARTLRGYPFKAAMHSKRQIAYIVQTHMDARQLLRHAGDTLNAGCVERAWAFTPGADVAANAPLDAFTEKVAEAWASVRNYNARLRVRRLPAHIFEREERLEGERGRVITRILDDHPLDRSR